MHGKLTALISKVRTIFSDIDKTLILEAAHIVLQLGVGVSARHNKVNAQHPQARQDARETFGVESFGVGEEGAIHIDGNDGGFSLHAVPFWPCYPIQAGVRLCLCLL